MDPQVQCPFCLSQISAKARVCRYCARDVRDADSLIVAQSQIDDLKAQLKKATVAVPPPEAKTHADYVVFGFYVLATLLYWYLIAPSRPSNAPADSQSSFVEQAIDLVALLAGVLLAFGSASYNPWWFLVLGFAQPVLTNIVLVLMNVLPIGDALALAPALSRVAIRTGGLMAAGGALTALAARTKRIRAVKVDTSVVRLHAMNDPDLERLAKIVLMIATIATPIISLLALWKASK